MSIASIIYTMIANLAVFILSMILLSAYFKMEFQSARASWGIGDSLTCSICITYLFWFFT